ncbi:PucR family transcriptional regulator [Paenibacillus gansuensis]|uniref:PucR family transcriptional regulator n=1 Tax=Paenibacillus gansuensis TaxID=306542 RepID=A0ABW5PH00_9BACL
MPTPSHSADRSFESLEQLADYIGDTLQCPVTIEDSDHRLLAYSTHGLHADSARIATIIGRRVPEHVIANLWKEDILPRLITDPLPLRIPAIPDIGLGSRVAVAIRKNDDVLGYIWLVEQQPLGNDEFILLQQAAAAAVPKLLQHRNANRRNLENRQDFFWQLLTSHLKSHEYIVERGRELSIPLPSVYRIAVLQTDAPVTSHHWGQLNYILSTAGSVNIPLMTSEGSHFILLTEAAKDRSVAESLVLFLQKAMLERFQVPLISEGFSDECSDYSLISAKYIEALSVIRCRRQFPQQARRFLLHADLGFYRVLPAIVEQNRAEGYANPILSKLRIYDKEHHGALTETLLVFLECDCHIKRTAEALHLHTNSLNYRLKRIAEVSGADLENMDQKVTLYLDLKAEMVNT